MFVPFLPLPASPFLPTRAKIGQDPLCGAGWCDGASSEGPRDDGKEGGEEGREREKERGERERHNGARMEGGRRARDRESELHAAAARAARRGEEREEADGVREQRGEAARECSVCAEVGCLRIRARGKGRGRQRRAAAAAAARRQPPLCLEPRTVHCPSLKGVRCRPLPFAPHTPPQPTAPSPSPGKLRFPHRRRQQRACTIARWRRVASLLPRVVAFVQYIIRL